MRIIGSLLAIGLAVTGALTVATPATGAGPSLAATAGGEAATSVLPAETRPPARPITVAIVAPVAAPPTVTGVLDAVALEELTRPGGLLAMQLGQLGGRQVTLGIDPMIIASIRALGSDAPDAATSWLARLAELPNASFALQWADANPSLSLQAAGVVLEAPTLPLDPELFAPEGTEPIVPGPGDPVLPALPDPEELTLWDHTLGAIAWPADHTMVESDLPGLEEHGFDAVIVNSLNVPSGRVKSPHVAFGAIDGVVSNDVVSSLLRATIAAPTDDAWALSFDGLAAALAQLSNAGERVISATLTRPDRSSPLRLSQTLDALAALEWVDLAPLDAVFEQPAVSTDFAPAEAVEPGEPAAERVQTVAEILGAEGRVRAFASVLDDPDPLLSARRAQVMALLGAGWSADDMLWAVAAQGFLTDCESILGAVTIQDSSTINLLAENGPFPVTVRNDLAHPVTVYVTVRPDRPILRVTDFRVPLSIAANTQAKAFVPVQVVANGQLTTTVSLSSADRTPIAEPTVVRLNVQAGWEGPVSIFLAGLVALMLVAGIWRTVRSQRRAAVTSAAKDAPPASPAAASEGAVE